MKNCNHLHMPSYFLELFLNIPNYFFLPKILAHKISV